MRFDSRVPAPPLAQHVALLWEWTGVTRTHAFERLMPNGEAAVIVNLKEDAIRVYDPVTLRLQRQERGAVILGAYALPSVIDCQEQDHVFGIQFRPGGAAAFLTLPASELTNEHVALNDVWRGIELRERLLAAGSAQARFDLAERLLRERFAAAIHPAVAAAIAAIERSHGRLRLGRLSQALGLSQRRLIQLFKREVGLPPKTFCRLRRFQSLLTAAHGQPARALDWSTLALHHGYCDQAHLIHEFGEFAGLRPTEYAAAAGHHPNHVPVMTAP